MIMYILVQTYVSCEQMVSENFSNIQLSYEYGYFVLWSRLYLVLYIKSIFTIYLGPKPFSDLYTIRRVLNSILNLTGSQCNDLSTGVMWSLFLVLVRIPSGSINDTLLYSTK